MEHEKICRLCLQECGNDFKVTEENVTKILGFLLQSNLFNTEEAVMCENCMESIKACSNFKRTCLDVDNLIMQCINRKNNNSKLNLKETNDIPKDDDICRFCMASLTIGTFISLDDVTVEMMQKCLPELDVSATEKPVICLSCRESLQHYFGFVTNCLMVEENIKKYCESAGVDNTSTIKLKDVLEFTTRNIFDDADGIKTEHNMCRMDEKKCDDEPCTLENNKVEIKIEESFLEKVDSKIELAFENWDGIEDTQVKFKLECEKGDEQFDVIELKDSYSQERANELEVEPENLNRFEVGIVSSQPVGTTRLHGKQDCLMPSLQGDIFSKPLSQMSLTIKKFTTTLMHECDFCPYRTQNECDLKNHWLNHKDPLEVTMYKCVSCSFQAKHRRSLARHSLRHKDPSEATMYKCDFCSFQTKHRRSLAVHVWKHKDPSEVTIYKCDSCLYQTKHRTSLNRHLLKHQNTSEVTMYKCEFCSFQTKHRRSLSRHLLNHNEDFSEVTMYKCDSCSYQTRYKGSLKSHLLIHKDPSEVTMYKCDFCSFQTKHRENLGKHLLMHKDPTETTMYKCDSCSFETKYRNNLKRHLQKHGDP